MNAWQVLGCVYDGLNVELWIGADWQANQANVCFARSGAQKLPDRNRPNPCPSKARMGCIPRSHRMFRIFRVFAYSVTQTN
jgi:hypothetical protein